MSQIPADIAQMIQRSRARRPGGGGGASGGAIPPDIAAMIQRSRARRGDLVTSDADAAAIMAAPDTRDMRMPAQPNEALGQLPSFPGLDEAAAMPEPAPLPAPDRRSVVGEFGAALARGPIEVARDIAATGAGIFAGPGAAADVRGAMQPPAALAPSREDFMGRVANLTGAMPAMLAEGPAGFAAPAYAQTMERTDNPAAALGAGVAGGALGAIPVAAVLGRIPGVPQLVQRFGLGPVQAFAAKYGVEMLASGAANVAQEEAVEQIARAGGADPMDTRPLESFLAGALPVGAIGAVRGGMQARGAARSADFARARQDVAQMSPDAARAAGTETAQTGEMQASVASSEASPDGVVPQPREGQNRPENDDFLPPLNAQDLASMTYADLRAEAKARGLPATGTRPQLVERLAAGDPRTPIDGANGNTATQTPQSELAPRSDARSDPVSEVLGQSEVPRTSDQTTPRTDPDSRSSSEFTHDFSSMTYADLRAEAKARGLPATGTRPQLVERLAESQDTTRWVAEPEGAIPVETPSGGSDPAEQRSQSGETQSFPESTPDYAAMTFAELRQEAHRRGIDQRGNRPAVIRRLEEADAAEAARVPEAAAQALRTEPAAGMEAGRTSSTLEALEDGTPATREGSVTMRNGAQRSATERNGAPKTGRVPAQKQAQNIPFSIPDAKAPETLAQRAQRNIDRIKAENAQARIPRGRNTGAAVNPITETWDAARIAFWRAVQAGDIAGRALTTHVRAAMQELGTKADETKVRAIVRGLIKDSKDDAGVIDLDRAEKATAEAFDKILAKSRPPAEVTDSLAKQGQAFEAGAKVGAKGLDAAKSSLARQGTVFEAGERAGKKAERAKAEGEMKSFRERAREQREAAGDLAVQREKFDRRGSTYKAEQAAKRAADKAHRDKVRAVYTYAERAALRAYRAGRDDVRTELREVTLPEIRRQAKFGKEQIHAVKDTVVSAVRESLPQRLHGKYLAAVRDVQTYPQLRRVLNKLERDVAESQMRDSVKLAMKAVSRAGKMKMLDEYKAAVADAHRQLDALRLKMKAAGTPEIMDTIREDAIRIKNTATEARTQQRNAQRIRLTETTYEREKLIEELAPQIRAAGKTLPDVGELPRMKQATIRGRIGQAHMTPDTIGAMMGNTVARRILSEEMWDGETLVHAATQRGEDSLKGWLKEAGYEWGADRTQRLSEVAAGRENAEILTFNLPNAGNLKMTPAEAMALYATLTDGRAGRQIAGGVPITFARDLRGKAISLSTSDLSNFLYQLDPKFRTMVEKAKSYVETEVRPGLFKAFREQKGYDLEHVPDYWRTRRNMKKATTMREDGIISMGKTMDRELTGLGFLKERVPSSKTPFIIGDFFSDFTEMVHKGAVVEHMTRRVRNAELVFGDQRIADELEARFGEGMNRRIEKVIDAGKLVFKEPMAPMEHLASALMKNYARTVLTLNPVTWLKQYGGIAKLGAYIDQKYIVAGLAKMNNKEARAEMMAVPYFRERYGEAVWRRVSPMLGERVPLLGASTTRNVAGRVVKSGARDKAAAVGELIDRIEILNWFDSQVATVAYVARKAQVKAEHPNIAEADARAWAARMAEYDFRRTQNTSSTLDMSGMALDHRGKLGAALIMFTSDANKSANMLMTSAHENRFKRVAAAIAVNTALAATVTALRGWLRDSAKDDDRSRRKTLVERFARAFAKDLTGLGYGGSMVGDVAEKIVDVALGLDTRQPYDVFTGPVAETLNQLFEAMVKGGEAGRAAMTGEKFKTGPRRGQSKAVGYGKDAAGKGMAAMGKLLGVPLEPPVKLIRDLINASSP